MPNLAAAYLALAVAYPLLAHWESHGGGAPAAALALADLALMMLLEPLMQRRMWAWALLVLVLGALVAAMREPWLPMLLLAPPALFTGWLAWVFARTLRPPREPLITRIAVALEFLARSRLGSSWLAVRHSERAAAANGINVPMAKLSAFAISAFIAGISGGLLAGYLGTLVSDNFSMIQSLVLFAVATMAGAHFTQGAIIGGVLMTLRLCRPLSRAGVRAVRAAAEACGRFVEAPVTLDIPARPRA